MTKILFVCHGNICRSPMAEFVMKDLVKKAGLADRVHIESVGVSSEEQGNPVYPPVRRLLNAAGIPCDGHHARKITRAQVEGFDRIYYMDSSNFRNLQRQFPGENKFQPLLNRDVADPYYYGGYDQTWQDIQEGCRRILEELQ